MRSVALGRVVAGATWPQGESSDPLGTQREPALAVDPDGYRADGVLLATGRRLALGQQTPTGMGLAAYGADRSLRFRLFQGASSWVVWAIGGRAYVESGIGQESVAVVDLGSGAVLDQRRGPLPT